jgi:hypothetical protein
MKTEKDFSTIYGYWAYLQGRLEAHQEDIEEFINKNTEELINKNKKINE